VINSEYSDLNLYKKIIFKLFFISHCFFFQPFLLIIIFFSQFEKGRYNWNILKKFINIYTIEFFYRRKYINLKHKALIIDEGLFHHSTTLFSSEKSVRKFFLQLYLSCLPPSTYLINIGVKNNECIKRINTRIKKEPNRIKTLNKEEKQSFYINQKKIIDLSLKIVNKQNWHVIYLDNNLCIRTLNNKLINLVEKKILSNI
jgi:hypothetical protein